jgi:hypothetical protein
LKTGGLFLVRRQEPLSLGLFAEASRKPGSREAGMLGGRGVGKIFEERAGGPAMLSVEATGGPLGEGVILKVPGRGRR